MRRFVPACVLAALVLVGHALFACSVPVFRYALERWQPDAFRVLVFHRGGLTESQQQQLARLNQAPAGRRGPANMDVETIDVETIGDSPDVSDEVRQLWERHKAEPLPAMVVYAPARFNQFVFVMSRPLTGEHVDSLLDSPVRRTVTDRILEGDSAVWVLLESGDAEADAAAAKTLQDALQRLQKELKLPEIDTADIEQENLTVDPEKLQLKFSMVRLSRSDPAEQAVVDMLLASEPDLRDEQFAGQPMAFPVFGRGRVLYALIGKGINDATISDACSFLAGACQCTVKAENPGVDLLTNVDWDARVVASIEEDVAIRDLVGLSQFGETGEPGESENAAGENAAGENAAGEGVERANAAGENESLVLATAPSDGAGLPADTDAAGDASSAGTVAGSSGHEEASSAPVSVGDGSATALRLPVIAICVLGGLLVVVAAFSLFVVGRG